MNGIWKCVRCETNNDEDQSKCFICGISKEDSVIREQALKERTAVLESAVLAARKRKAEIYCSEDASIGEFKSFVITPEPEKPERKAVLPEEERIFRESFEDGELDGFEKDEKKSKMPAVAAIIVVLLAIALLVIINLNNDNNKNQVSAAYVQVTEEIDGNGK